MNQVLLMGRLVNEPFVQDNVTTLTLGIKKYYKNQDGIYDTDFVDIIISDNISKPIFEYCKNGDMIAVKGEVKTMYENDKKVTNVFGEKITFLSSKKED